MDGAQPFDAVILAGGHARRLGGVDKPGLDIGGTTLLERVAAAVPGAGRVIVVGPQRSSPPALYVREDPPGAGPVTALRAGMDHVAARWFALLAGDMPFLKQAHIAVLRLAAMEPGRDGAVLLDDAGHPQWLVGVWDPVRVRTALDGYQGSSLRGLLGALNYGTVQVSGPAVLDCDTPEDLEQARKLTGAEED